MKYYSDLTKKLYDSEQECAEAEATLLKKRQEEEEATAKKAQERKARAEAIDASYERLAAAQKEYSQLVSEFVKDYGAYHKTYSNNNHFPFDSIFASIFD